MNTNTIRNRLSVAGRALFLGLSFFFGQVQAADVTYGGIYQWSAGQYLSLHQDGTNMIATIYFTNDGNFSFPAPVGGGVRPVPQLDIFDLMNGHVTGSTAKMSGTRFHRACRVDYDFTFNSDATLTVTRTGVSNAPVANAAGISCSAIVATEATTLIMPKIFFGGGDSAALRQDVTAVMDNIIGMIGGDGTGITQQLSVILQQVFAADSGSTCPSMAVTPALTSLEQIPANLQIQINYAANCTAADGKVMNGSATISFTNLKLTSDDVAKTISLYASSFSLVFNNIKVNGATFANGAANGDMDLKLGQDAQGAPVPDSGHLALQMTNFMVPNGNTMSGTTTLTVASQNNMRLAINLTTTNGAIVLNLSALQQADGSTLINTIEPGQGKGYVIEIKNLLLNTNTCTSNYPIGGRVIFTKAGQTATVTFDASCSGKYDLQIS